MQTNAMKSSLGHSETPVRVQGASSCIPRLLAQARACRNRETRHRIPDRFHDLPWHEGRRDLSYIETLFSDSFPIWRQQPGLKYNSQNKTCLKSIHPRPLGSRKPHNSRRGICLPRRQADQIKAYETWMKYGINQHH